ncbi:MAG: hypothetical protein ACYS0E_02140 [Planctomycetota bacterium]
MRALLLSAVLLVGCAPSRSYRFDEPGPPPSRHARTAAASESNDPPFIAELLWMIAGFIPDVGIH